MTEIVFLPALASGLLDAARKSGGGRAAHTIHGGQSHSLRQTVLALVGGFATGEHGSPGEATLQVLLGRVRLTSGPDQWEAGAGDHLVIPPSRHDLAAMEDSAVLLTVATPR